MPERPGYRLGLFNGTHKGWRAESGAHCPAHRSATNDTFIKLSGLRVSLVALVLDHSFSKDCVPRPSAPLRHARYGVTVCR